MPAVKLQRSEAAEATKKAPIEATISQTFISLPTSSATNIC